MPARPFLFEQSQAGCFHIVNLVYDRDFLLDQEAKELLVKLLRTYEDVFGIEVLTFCVMDKTTYQVICRKPLDSPKFPDHEFAVVPPSLLLHACPSLSV